ncbi:MAG: hypothetical protein WC748_03015 [Legionellales bacterium]|jgi:hypothetical protein
MAKIKILNQEISVLSFADLKNEKTLASLKSEILKKSILESLRIYMQSQNLPSEFLGFLLLIESEVKAHAFLSNSNEALLTWLEGLITRIQKREVLYERWHKITQVNKLSIILTQIKTKFFSDECMSRLSYILNQAYCELRNQLEFELILQMIEQAIHTYNKTAFWPINEVRRKQQHDLLLLIQQAPNALCALHILTMGIMQIEQHHIVNSMAANCPYFQTKSRLAYQLNLAVQTLSGQVNHASSSVQTHIEHAINHYLSEDMFYHNRKRRVIALQLLMQLHADNTSFTGDQQLQRKNQMRTTLDNFIQKIDEDFKSTYFFSKFYTQKRSRLALHLESMKIRLIHEGKLSHLELEQEVKLPIIKVITQMINLEKDDADIVREMNTLLLAIKEAHTPHTIGAILEGHIHCYLQENNRRYAIALKLETDFLSWQTRGLLPATGEYKNFLQKLAHDRQTLENQRPINDKAHALLKRIQNLS